MTFAATLSSVGAALELLVAWLCLGFARAPGWGRLRLFGLLALTAAAYSLSSVPQTLTSDPALIAAAGRVSIAAVALHVLAWTLYSSGHGGARHRLRRVDVALGWGLGVVALLGLWPGVLAARTVHAHEVPALGLRYHTADATALGEAAFLLVLLAGLVPAWRYLRGVRAGIPGSWPHLLGLTLLLSAGVAEALIAAQLLVAPYTLDLGFLAATLTIGAELVGRVTGDAERLTRLSARLERTVQERTEELARAQAALARQERLAALGRLAGGVAHQINSPLSAINANAGFLQEELAAEAPAPAAELLQASREIGEAALRIRDLVVDLKLFARGPDRVGANSAEVRPVLDAALRLLRHELGEPGLVAVEDGGVPPVEADPAGLAQVLTSLLGNAVQALPAGRRQAGAVVVRTLAAEGQVLIEVEDRGDGMSEEQVARAFEPFFTTRATAGAAGMGLSVSHGLVRAMGGRLELTSEVGRGTRVQVWLRPAAGLSAPRRTDRSAG